MAEEWKGKVMIRGLRKRTDLNSKEARVLTKAACPRGNDGRVPVEVSTHSKERVWVKPTNLGRVDADGFATLPDGSKVMPTVIVESGAHVEKDEQFAEIEVMKMVMPLCAPEPGTVTWGKPEGAVMNPGDVIATLELDASYSLSVNATPPFTAPSAAPAARPFVAPKTCPPNRTTVDTGFSETDVPPSSSSSSSPSSPRFFILSFAAFTSDRLRSPNL